MAETVVTDPLLSRSAGESDLFIRAFRLMLLGRALDDKLGALYRAGKIHGGVFLGRGQEALSVALPLAMTQGDVYAPLIRDAAGRLAFGETVMEAMRTCLGSVMGPMRGRDGNVHRGRPRDGYLPMISHLGAMIAVVNGALMARRMAGKGGCLGGACLGDGGTSTGAFHEALNQAAVEKLPLVLVVADNQFAYSTPTSKQFACGSLLDRASSYGVRGWDLDGTDLAECLRVVGSAARQARDGAGPQLVVGHLLRLCGHGEHDDASYISSELKQSPLGRDCLTVAESQLREKQWADAQTVRQWRREAVREIEEAATHVQREPGPDPYKENWCALASKHLSEGYTDL